MSSSKTSNSFVFVAIATVTLVATGTIMAIGSHMVEKSGGWQLQMAQAAVAIAPHSARLSESLARAEIEAGRPTEAISVLTKHTGSKQLAPSSVELLAAAYSLNEKQRSGRLTQLGATATDSEARRAIVMLAGSKTTQAQELYVLGLVRSSQRVVKAIHQPSAALYTLEGDLSITEHGRRGAAQALKYYQSALALTPTSKPLIEKALAVSQQTSNASLAKQYQAQLTSLNSSAK